MTETTKKAKIDTLTFIDLCILAGILFALPIWDSYQYFAQLNSENIATGSAFEYSGQAYLALVKRELLVLFLAAAYLIYRRFDFRQLPFHLNTKAVLVTLGIILFAGSLTHIFYETMMPIPTETEQEYDLSGYFSLSLFLFSFVNGFYEEIYFLGLAFCSSKRWRPYILIFVLVIRVSFHTYQGVISTFGILLFGVILTLLRFKIKNLLPFTIAHSFFDIFGLGLPLWLIP